MKNIRIAFFGTPQLCCDILDTLVMKGMTPIVVVTAPDRPVGRRQIITPPPVKTWAHDRSIDILQPEKLDENFLQQLSAYNVDLNLVVAFGMIMPESIINIAPHGTLNVHYSLLPHWRGASPVEQTILSDDTHTGVSIQKMRKRLDSGPIIATSQTMVLRNETAPSLRTRLNALACDILPSTINAWTTGQLTPIEQDETLATFCRKFSKTDGEIHLTDNPEMVWRKYRAYIHWPGIYFFTPEGKRMKIALMHKEKHACIITRIIPEGKTETSVHINIGKDKTN